MDTKVLKENMERSLFHSMGKTIKTVHMYYSKAFEMAGAPVHFDVWIKLYVLHCAGDEVQKNLADISGIHKATMTRTIDTLEENGYVERNQDERDRRQKVITVTKRGEELIDEYTHLMCEGEKKLLQGLTEADLKSFYKVLGNITANLVEND